MSIEWYDKALINKIRSITGDGRISIVGPNQIYRFAANVDEDNTTFPLISVTRGNYSIQIPHRTKLSSEGWIKSVDLNAENGIMEVQMIPATISYVLDVIAKTREENDIISEEILFYFINNPTLVAYIEKGINYSHNFNIFIDKTVSDNSQIETFINKMQFFRTTFNITVPDAYMWKSTKKSIYTVGKIELNEEKTTIADHSLHDIVKEDATIQELAQVQGALLDLEAKAKDIGAYDETIEYNAPENRPESDQNLSRIGIATKKLEEEVTGEYKDEGDKT